MKTPLLLLLSLFFSLAQISAQAQAADSSMIGKMVVVITNDGGENVGTLMSDDGREILLATTDKGKIFIPKYTIKKIELLHEKNTGKNGFMAPTSYGHRYIFSPSAIPMGKEDITLRFPYLAGAILDVGISDEFSASFGTAWFFAFGFGGTYRHKIPSGGAFGFSAAAGGLTATFGIGTDYASLSGFMARGFYTFGSEEKSITLGTGYASLFNMEDHSYFFNLSGSARLNKKLSITGEGYILPEVEAGSMAWALRIHTQKGRAWDIGFMAFLYSTTYYVYNGNTMIPNTGIQGIALPYVGYHLKF